MSSFQKDMRPKLTTVLIFVIVCSIMYESCHATQHAVHTASKTGVREKQVNTPTYRKCPIGHLMDKSGICRMIW